MELRSSIVLILLEDVDHFTSLFSSNIELSARFFTELKNWFIEK
jgi:hypothetical protein